MLSTELLRTHLARITYKPGWSLELREGRWEGQHLVITTVVEDAFKPGEKVTLDVHSPIPHMHSFDQFDEWLMWRLWRIESHEMREWFKRDGKVVSSPHADGADRDL